MVTTMYDDLVKKLRYCGNAVSCIHCPYWEGCEGSKEDLIKAADAIEELSRDLDYMNDANIALYGALPQWIPLSERLPNGNGEYFVSGKGKVWVCEFMILGNVGGWCNSAMNPCVSHWMPLPEPPKAEKGE